MARKQLNSRERFQATFNYTQPDHVFLMFNGPSTTPDSAG